MAKRKNIIMQFNSLSEFLRHIAQGEIQPDFLKYWIEEDKLRSKCTTDSQCKFAGTRSLEEADRLLHDGDRDNMELLKKYGFEPDVKKYNFAQRRKITPAVVGFAPIVPNAIAGVPVAMQRVEQIKVQQRVVNVVLSVGFDYTIDKKDYATFAAKVLNACISLEKRNIRVNLYVVMGAREKNKIDGQHVVSFVKIKDSKQAIDPLSVAYPVINASFLRRHNFRLIETTPGVSHLFCSNYGVPLSSDTIKKFLPAQLKNSIVMTYYDRKRLDKIFNDIK